MDNGSAMPVRSTWCFWPCARRGFCRRTMWTVSRALSWTWRSEERPLYSNCLLHVSKR